MSHPRHTWYRWRVEAAAGHSAQGYVNMHWTWAVNVARRYFRTPLSTLEVRNSRGRIIHQEIFVNGRYVDVIHGRIYERL